nr:hypothetical protein BaRGS_023651 [Batillaria attramentaria]
MCVCVRVCVRACVRRYGDPSTSSLNPCGKGNHSYPDEHRARQVQKAAIQLDVLASFTGFLPAVIPTIFLGPATDVLGRRIGFVLPVLGTVARSLVFLFVYGTGASVYYMYIGTTLEASQPRSDGGDTHSSCCGTALRGVARSVKVYFRVNPELPARRCVLVLCFTAFILTVAVNFSKPVVETVYRMGELCWNAIKETEFDSGWLIAHWVCILIALHVFQRRLGVPDVYIAMMGCVSGIAAPAVFAFAKNSAIVFVSAACGTMGRALIPMLRSMASAVVDTDEQELAGAALFGMAFGQLYRVTLDIWTGIVFLVLAGIMVLVFILLICAIVQ